MSGMDEQRVALLESRRPDDPGVENREEPAAEASEAPVARWSPKWARISEKSAFLLAVWGDRAARDLGRAATAAGEWLQRIGLLLQRRTYRTGRRAYEGVFSCTGCGELKVLSRSGPLSACASCAGTEFRRAP